MKDIRSALSHLAVAFAAAGVLAFSTARADAPAAAAPPATTPAATPAATTPAKPAPAPGAAKVEDKSPWSVLGVFGGGLIGLGAGVTAVSTLVLVTESKTTITLYRYIELGVGSAEIATGITLVVIDGLTE